MTREEAIIMLIHTKEFLMSDRICWSKYDCHIEAIDIAISALKNEPILCKDCIQKHIGGSVTHYYWCDRWDMEVDDTDFCSWGERREEKQCDR